MAGRQECLPHPRCGFFTLTVGRRYDRNISLIAIAKHVILSGAKNLPSFRLYAQRARSPAHMRGGIAA